MPVKGKILPLFLSCSEGDRMEIKLLPPLKEALYMISYSGHCPHSTAAQNNKRIEVMLYTHQPRPKTLVCQLSMGAIAPLLV